MNATPLNASALLQQTKPDFARCLERIEAWFHQAVLDRPPMRFYKHNAQFEGGEPLDRTRWAWLEERWFDTDYQIDAFERSIAGKTFHAETFPVFFPIWVPASILLFTPAAWSLPRSLPGTSRSWRTWRLPRLACGRTVRQRLFQEAGGADPRGPGAVATNATGSATPIHPSLDCVAAWLRH